MQTSPPTDQVRVHQRWLIRRDMPEVLQIENQGFTRPWAEEDFLRCLRQRNCIGMVAEAGEKVVGFIIYELQKTKLHILNMAVHLEYRRRGIGRQMLARLVSKLASHHRSGIQLEVSEVSLQTQQFLRAQAFRATRVLRNFYDNGEDAFLFAYEQGDVLTHEEAASLQEPTSAE